MIIISVGIGALFASLYVFRFVSEAICRMTYLSLA